MKEKLTIYLQFVRENWPFFKQAAQLVIELRTMAVSLAQRLAEKLRGSDGNRDQS